MPPLSYQSQETLFWTLMSLFYIPYFVLWAILLSFFRDTETIKRRNPILVYAIAVGHFLFFHGIIFSCTIFKDYLHGFSNPWIVHLLATIGGSMFLMAYSIMALSLGVNQLLAHARLNIENNAEGNIFDSAQITIIKIFMQLKHDPFEKRVKNNSRPSVLSPSQQSLSQAQSERQSTSKFDNLNGHIPDRVVLMHLGGSVILSTIISVISIVVFMPMGYNSQYTSTFLKLMIFGLTVVSLSMLIDLFVSIRKFKDSLGIKNEITAFIGYFLIITVAYQILEYAPFMNGTDFQQNIGSNILLLVETYVTLFASSGYVLSFAYYEKKDRNKMMNINHNLFRKSTMIKSNENIQPKVIEKRAAALAYGMDDLIDITLNPSRFKKLKKSLAEDLAPENAMFVEDLIQGYAKLGRTLLIFDHPPVNVANHLSQAKVASTDNLSQVPESNIKNLNEINEMVFLKYLYKKYIQPNSPNELNIPSKFRKEITAKLIEERNGNLTIGLYDKVRDESIDEMDFERSIHNAAHKNNIHRVEKFPDHLVNQYDSAGYLPLHYAVRQGYLEMSKLLVRKGACVNAKTKGGQVSVLHRACISGNLELVKYLMEQGADLQAIDKDERSVFDVAMDNPELLAILNGRNILFLDFEIPSTPPALKSSRMSDIVAKVSVISMWARNIAFVTWVFHLEVTKEPVFSESLQAISVGIIVNIGIKYIGEQRT
ncbi:hypothetical protein HDV06_005896 [Boothiomyces sp. JEL0866]|nr:hypothetical protein HDV06_005896 [Boothiomyces sp. JEL0866]